MEHDFDDPVAATQFAGLRKAYTARLESYMMSVVPYWAAKVHSGELSNFEQSITAAVTWGKSGYEAGCVACQAKTWETLSTQMVTYGTAAVWELKRWVVGNIMEHHAVLCYRKGKAPETGYMFDPWIDQKPRVYPYDAWLGKFNVLNAILKSRPQDD